MLVGGVKWTGSLLLPVATAGLILGAGAEGVGALYTQLFGLQSSYWHYGSQRDSPRVVATDF